MKTHKRFSRKIIDEYHLDNINIKYLAGRLDKYNIKIIIQEIALTCAVEGASGFSEQQYENIYKFVKVFLTRPERLFFLSEIMRHEAKLEQPICYSFFRTYIEKYDEISIDEITQFLLEKTEVQAKVRELYDEFNDKHGLKKTFFFSTY